MKFMIMEFLDVVAIRTPFGLGGLATTSCEIYVMLSNFAFSGLAYSTASTNVLSWMPPSHAIGCLACLTTIYYFATAVIWYFSLPGSARRLFLQHQTPKSYLRDVLWNTPIYTTLGTTLDDHRALLMMQFIPYYWCKEDVREWLTANWTAWCE